MEKLPELPDSLMLPMVLIPSIAWAVCSIIFPDNAYVRLFGAGVLIEVVILGWYELVQKWTAYHDRTGSWGFA